MNKEVRAFIDHHYRHFNAASLRDAARGYEKLIDSGGKMFVTLAGAMSTAELGISLAEMIRQDKIHGICCTGANLEEDLFNLVAHDKYRRIPDYRDLTPQEEADLFKEQMNRVTDTCIPEEEAMDLIEDVIVDFWKQMEKDGKRLFPHEVFYEILRSKCLESQYQIDPKNSWMIAAAEAELPIVVPGWEDSSVGNIFAARLMDGTIKNRNIVKDGMEYMMSLTDWYRREREQQPIGFFQIGGGIAGDFPICVVPLITQDLEEEVAPWAYFCQISDAVTSYGGYSGAVPNEKITWGKIGVDTPTYIIESDATIVAPLIFSYLLGR